MKPSISQQIDALNQTFEHLKHKKAPLNALDKALFQQKILALYEETLKWDTSSEATDIPTPQKSDAAKADHTPKTTRESPQKDFPQKGRNEQKTTNAPASPPLEKTSPTEKDDTEGVQSKPKKPIIQKIQEDENKSEAPLKTPANEQKHKDISAKIAEIPREKGAKEEKTAVAKSQHTTEKPKAETVAPKPTTEETKTETPSPATTPQDKEAAPKTKPEKPKESRQQPKETAALNEKFSQQETTSLNDRFHQKDYQTKGEQVGIKSLKKSIALNQKIAFLKELFKGDFNAYNKAIEALDNAGSLDEATKLIDQFTKKYDWDKTNLQKGLLEDLVKRKYRHS